MEPSQLGWEPLVHAYIEYKMPEVLKEMKKIVLKRLKWFLTPSLLYVQKHGKLPFLVDDMQMTDYVLKIFNCCADWI